MKQAEVEKNWKQRGFSCGLRTDPPGRRWEGFVHEGDELLMVLEGAIEVEIEGKTLRPQKGEEVFIPAQARHSVRNVGPTTARWLYGYKKSR